MRSRRAVIAIAAIGLGALVGCVGVQTHGHQGAVEPTGIADSKSGGRIALARRWREAIHETARATLTTEARIPEHAWLERAAGRAADGFVTFSDSDGLPDVAAHFRFTDT